MSLEIVATIAPKVTFASHQNSVPVVCELKIENSSDTAVESVFVEITSSPTVLTPRRWPIDRISAHSTAEIQDLDVELNGALLLDLHEAVRATVTIRVLNGEEELAHCEFPIEALARTEWGGATMPELLAAFIMPNDPAIEGVLKEAARVLTRAGKSDRLNGYEDGDSSRIWEVASAIWSAISGRALTYTLPPASFEIAGQKIRPPSVILSKGLATCLDTACLFAAALEQAGLNPIVVLTRGHAFAGVWLQPTPFSDILVDEAANLRKRVKLQELVVFETTLCMNKPAPSFSRAIRAADTHISEEVEDSFIHALDLRRARMQRLRPIALRLDDNASALGPEQPSVAESLEQAPLLPRFSQPKSEPSARSSHDRLREWRRKLLDLTLRNRLLNTKPSKTALKLHCPDLGALEDRLAQGRAVKVVPTPAMDAGGRDPQLHHRRTGEELLQAYSLEALGRDEILSPLSPTELSANLIELYRKARSDIQEGGANTLFLAIGFLSWKREPEETKSYRAPLILIPVNIERKTARSEVRLVAHEDKPRFNGTLLEMLRQDFELFDLDGFEAELPSDENGVDVATVLNSVRVSVKEIRGFEVVEEAMLGTFSFAKYLMWKDLTDRTDQLLQNRTVRHLLETPKEPYPTVSDIPSPYELDSFVEPRALFTPLPTDSSQLAAIVASTRDCDFVLDGPPGTGKSQTIANIIAHNLAHGRKVLFVAEKMAALNVVYSRLAAKGLGPFCLELHSSKANKTDVIQQLGRAWDTIEAAPGEVWERDAERLKLLRDDLNGFVKVLHANRPGGTTLYEAIGLVVRDGGPTTPLFTWPEDRELNESTLARMRDVARRLGLNASNVARLDQAAFAWIGTSDWSPRWETNVVELASRLAAATREMQDAHDDFCAAVKITGGSDFETLVAFSAFAKALREVDGLDVGFAFAADRNAVVTSVNSGIQLIAAYNAHERHLSTIYSLEAARRVPTADLERNWRASGARWWPISALGRDAVRKSLMQTGGTAAKPDPGRDLPILAEMATQLEALDGLEASCRRVSGWAGLLTSSDTVALTIAKAKALISSLTRLAHSADDLASIQSAVANVALSGNALLGEAMPIRRSLDRFVRAFDSYNQQLAGFCAAAGTPDALKGGETTLNEVAATVDLLLAGRAQFNAWSAWLRARDEARDLGLEPLVDAVESRMVESNNSASAFDVGYASWLAKMLIGSEPRLRQFVSIEHELKISDFRELDEKLSNLASTAIRARLSGQIPRKDEKGLDKRFGALRHQLTLKAPRKAIRELAQEMGEALTTLTPCLLMSPLSVAQFLPSETALFDLVIFDEASQITPWDAIGAIARGRQLIVAGDPNQMPPTNFFNRESGDEEEADGEELQESILDQCLGASLPRHRLTWHYRSRHESLIAFANSRYYGNELVTFPAAVTKDSAVSFRKVEGQYAKGKGRTNQEEARAVVSEIVRRLKDPAFIDEKGKRLTLGAITLNAEQQKLIEDLLDKERQAHPEIEPYFDEALPEPVVVKNLERIQGDERDLILLSVGYGPTARGAPDMSMNFGPLNQKFGWRRWNVAVTRARREMVLFSSFDGGMIDINRSSARAVKDLRDYQDFAIRGMSALPRADLGSLGDYESPFEVAVGRRLREKGWEVRTQIGASRFRIDLGIVHPDRPGDYLCGVECDGATYHRAATARDRDKVRQSILNDLGWDLLRVWSTDWWHDPGSALSKIELQLREKLQKSRKRHEDAKVSSAVSTAAVDASSPTDVNGLMGKNNPEIAIFDETVAKSILSSKAVDTGAPMAFARSYAEPYQAQPSVFRRTDLSRFAPLLRPNLFYDDAYEPVLREIVAYIVKSEAPLRDEVLVERVARAHGFQRSGRIIRERILTISNPPFVRFGDKVGGFFIWPDADARQRWSIFRPPASDDDIRPIEDVASEELRAGNVALVDEDVPLEISRRLGTHRLSATGRARIVAALERE